MKVVCEYCGGYIDSSNEMCPNCGATNTHLVRTASDTPKTIEELQAWYRARNLPPAHITRYFIGVDCLEPKAFGIYRTSDNKVVVYKNDASGNRKIRYEGHDEAYGVNELYLKLKESILKQKAHNQNGRLLSPEEARARQLEKNRRKRRRNRMLPGIFTALLFIGMFVLAIFYVKAQRAENARRSFVPDIPEGYYATELTEGYDGDFFYYLKEDNQWFRSYPTGWSKTSTLPEDLTATPENEDEVAKLCLGTEYKDSYYDDYYAKDFLTSVQYADYKAGDYVAVGYYQYEDITYYHMKEDYRDGWFYFNDDDEEWHPIGMPPEDLKHSSMASDFYYHPDWDSEIALTDFTDTGFYSNYQVELKEQSSSNSSSSSHDSSYDWDSNDSWDSDIEDWDSDWFIDFSIFAILAN